MIPATIVANRYIPTMLPSIQVKFVVNSMSSVSETGEVYNRLIRMSLKRSFS